MTCFVDCFVEFFLLVIIVSVNQGHLAAVKNVLSAQKAELADHFGGIMRTTLFCGALCVCVFAGAIRFAHDFIHTKLQ